MTATELTEKVQDGVLKAVETSQRWTLQALRTTSSAFDGVLPDTSKIPFADKLPTPTETVDMTFAFTGRLLEAQHAFVSSLLELSDTARVPAKKA
jgi:hypothetical protein